MPLCQVNLIQIYRLRQVIKIFKKIRITLCIVFALCSGLFAALCIYSCNQIPDRLYISEGDTINIDSMGPMCRFFRVNSHTSGVGELDSDGRMRAGGGSVTVSFLGLDIKDIGISFVDTGYVIPCGDTVGIRIYAGGLVVLRITSFVSENGIQVRPWAGTGIRKGDIIRKADGQAVTNISALSAIVHNCDSDIELEIQRGEQIVYATLRPEKDRISGNNKLGLIVRDSMAGIGTLTYYNPADGTFGALGHPIEDNDTGIIFPLDKGTLESAEVINVVKGRKGMPGEIHGMFAGKEPIGTILANSSIGVYGTADNPPDTSATPMPTAHRSAVTIGAAAMMCTVDGEGVKSFDIEIEKILHHGTDSTKSMVIHITDPKLLSVTGGIIQGMSGSPIVQNGKLVGAVTHVFVNDPTRGYGIFIENMLTEAEKIK